MGYIEDVKDFNLSVKEISIKYNISYKICYDKRRKLNSLNHIHYINISTTEKIKLAKSNNFIIKSDRIFDNNTKDVFNYKPFDYKYYKKYLHESTLKNLDPLLDELIKNNYICQVLDKIPRFIEILKEQK